MRKLLRQWAWRRVIIWYAIAAAAAVVLCFVPLLDLLGYEFSLVMAALASLAAGHLAAGYPARVRDQLAPFPGARLTVLRLYTKVAAMAGLSLALPLLAITANALRVRNCDYLEGLGFFLLGPVCSCLWAAAWGLTLALLQGERFLALTLALSHWERVGI